MSLLVALIVALQGGQKVSLGLPSDRLDRQLDALGKALDLKLQASPALKDRYMVIALYEAEPKAALAQVASTALAEWEQRGDTYWLVPSSRLRSQFRADALAVRIARLQKEINRVTKLFSDMPKFDPKAAGNLADNVQKAIDMGPGHPREFNRAQFEQEQKLQDMLPEQRLLHRFMIQYGAKNFAELKSGDRIVFSFTPNRMQVPMPNGMQGAWNEFVREQANWVQSRSRLKAGGDEDYRFWNFRNSPSVENTKKVIAVLSRDENNSSLSIKAADAKGKLVFSTTKYLGNEFGDPEDMEGLNTPPSDPLTFEPAGEKISLKPLFEQQKLTLTPEVRKIILHPDVYDPSTLFDGNVWVQLSKKLKKSITILHNDNTCFLGGYLTSGPKMNWKSFGPMLKAMVVMKEDESTISMTSNQEADPTFVPVDRKALARLMQRIDSEGFMSLDASAEFALSRPVGTADMDFVTMIYLAAMFGETEFMGGDDRPALQLYGAMSPAQRSEWAKAKTKGTPLMVSVSSLTPYQRGVLEAMVFRARNGSGIDEIGAPEEASGAPDEVEGAIYYGTLRQEPTEMMPNGVPASTTYSMNMDFQTVVFTSENRRFMSRQGMDANGLAWRVYSKANPDRFPWSREEPAIDLDHLKVGRREKVEFGFQLMPKLFKSCQATRERSDSKELKLSQLPPDFLKAYKDALSNYETTYKNLPPGANPGGGPPPPPAR
jgi:hypothetical protein